MAVAATLHSHLATAAPRGGIQLSRTAAARNRVGLCAPHPHLLFWKRVGRKRRHVRSGQIPLKADFFRRRAQLTSVRRELAASLFVVHPTCALYPAEKNGRGFDFALYRRGAGRLVGGYECRLATRASLCGDGRLRKHLATRTGVCDSGLNIYWCCFAE